MSGISDMIWTVLDAETRLRKFATVNELFQLTQPLTDDAFKHQLLVRIALRMVCPDRFPHQELPLDQCDLLLAQVRKNVSPIIENFLKLTCKKEEDEPIQRLETTLQNANLDHMFEYMKMLFTDHMSTEELIKISKSLDGLLINLGIAILREKGDTVLDIALEPEENIPENLTQMAFDQCMEMLKIHPFFGAFLDPTEERVHKLLGELMLIPEPVSA